MQPWLTKHVEKREKWRKKVEAYTNAVCLTFTLLPGILTAIL